MNQPKVTQRLARKIDKSKILASAEVLDVIKTLLESDLEGKVRELRNMETLDMQSVARNIGEQKMLQNLIQLVTVRSE